VGTGVLEWAPVTAQGADYKNNYPRGAHSLDLPAVIG
jgi:hypothetical protein